VVDGIEEKRKPLPAKKEIREVGCRISTNNVAEIRQNRSPTLHEKVGKTA
jgi:hypothetical protein